MSAGIHKGMSSLLKIDLQLAGLKIDEEVAQNILIGRDVKIAGPALSWALSARDKVMDTENRLSICREWENSHPGENPFPKLFAEIVRETLLSLDPENPGEQIQELIALAETELGF